MKLSRIFLIASVGIFLMMGYSSLNAQSRKTCNDWNVLRFSDGSTACMTDYKFFNLPTRSRGDKIQGGISELAELRKSNFAVSMVRAPNKCPINFFTHWGGEISSPTKALEACNKRVSKIVSDRGLSASNCECEIIYSFEYGDKPNVPITRKNFEDKIQGWLWGASFDPDYKDYFSPEERDINKKFFADYKKRLDAEDAGNLLTLKASEKAPSQKENFEKELLVKKNSQQEVINQLKEKEQRLAEELRIKAEIAEKTRLNTEQRVLEERRIQAELAAKAQAEKEQREQVYRQQKESEQKAKTQTVSESIAKSQAIGKRLALVIGNAKYQQRPLDNAVNDANDMSKALKASGFEVIDVRDANLVQMRTAVRNFGDRLLNNDVGLVYYSGHGVEVKGKNYFIPVNADIKRADEIADQSLDVGLVLDKMETAQKPVNILIVDACRDDPFGRGVRSGSRGLATMDAPRGTIIAFATSPGKVAADGDGRNSPYTKNLVQAMQEPNMPIEQVFKKVRRAVQQETRNQQTPWENTSLSGDFYFKIQ